MLFSESLKKNHQFRMVYNRGRSTASKNLVFVVHKNGLEINRVGVSISKKVGKSVVRNRVRRLIKESYRSLEPKIRKGYDMIIIARQPVVELNFNEVKSNVLYLLKKQNLYFANRGADDSSNKSDISVEDSNGAK